MPLIEYVGNASPQDRTEVIHLNNAADGSARSISVGDRALVSGEELRALASGFQVRVVEDTDEKDSSKVPTEMPADYGDDGYKKDESPQKVIFTAENYPDDESNAGSGDSTTTADVSAPADTPSSTAAAAQAGAQAPSASPAPSIPSAPPASTPSSAPSGSPAPDSPGASG